MAPVVIGIAIGVTGAFWTSRLIASLLYEVRPYDPLTYLSVTGLVVLLAAAACYLPARNVLGVDPSVALRTE